MGDAPAPAIDNSEKPKHIPQTRLSLRRAFRVAAYSVGACMFTWLCRGIYVYWSDVKMVNFLAAWIPFALSVLLAFVPEHEMTKSKKLLWRSGVIGIGFIWSAVLWHQQVVVDRAAREDQERIVTTAVSQSNQHADQQIGNVRDDVKGVKGDVREVKGDLATTTHDIRDALSQSGIEIGHSIEKVNKPALPELAQLEFSFFSPNTTTFPFRTTSISPDKDGNYPVEVYFTNMTDVTAEEIDIWLAVCDDCSFVAEPAGFDRPKGTSEQMRHLTIHGLNPGTSWEKISLLVKSPIVVTPSTYFSLAFLYSCKTCGKKKPAQIAKVYGRP